MNTPQPFTRRTLVQGAVGLTAGIGLTGIAAVPASALPTVSMTALVLAAQVDPARPKSDPTPGSAASVKLVEQALQARGLLAAKYVDGHFGTITRAAYAKFQRSLGYSGLGANGIPGPASLKKLGAGRFTVADVITVGGKVTHQGWTLNVRTRSMLIAAQKRAGATFTLSQGSYRGSASSASASTHVGGGAIDITAPNYAKAVKALREVGFAAWVRTPSQGNWNQHIHGIAVGDTDVHQQAADQVSQYYRGLNGLRGQGRDDGPAVKKVLWEQYVKSGGVR